jgi:hypothetical protein
LLTELLAMAFDDICPTPSVNAWRPFTAPCDELLFLHQERPASG